MVIFAGDGHHLGGMEHVAVADQCFHDFGKCFAFFAIENGKLLIRQLHLIVHKHLLCRILVAKVIIA